jgi:small subunit ribosomal protein S21
MLSLAGGIHSGRSIKLIAINGTKQRKTETAPIVIKLRESESIDHALRRFKRKCQYAGIFKDVKKSSYYIKQSDKKKIARNEAKRRSRRSPT